MHELRFHERVFLSRGERPAPVRATVSGAMFLPILLAPLSACKVIEAPESLEDVVVYGFRHYDDEQDYLVATHANLRPEVEAHLEELVEGYLVSDLASDDLAVAGVKNADVSNVIGALATVTYTHPLDEIIGVLTRTDKAEIFEDTLIYEVLESSGRQCFLDRSCDRLDYRIHEVTTVPILGEAERTFDISYRWVETDDGTWVVYQRTLNPDPITFSTDLLKVYQQYQLVTLYPDDGGARRVEAFWVDAEIVGMDMPESLAITTAVSTMEDQAAAVDAYLDGA